MNPVTQPIEPRHVTWGGLKVPFFTGVVLPPVTNFPSVGTSTPQKIGTSCPAMSFALLARLCYRTARLSHAARERDSDDDCLLPGPLTQRTAGARSLWASITLRTAEANGLPTRFHFGAQHACAVNRIVSVPCGNAAQVHAIFATLALHGADGGSFCSRS